MNIVMQATEYLNPGQVPVVAVDQPLFALAKQIPKCLVCVCYRPPNCDLKDWLNLFAAFLQVADNYQKILITGDLSHPLQRISKNLFMTFFFSK